MLADRGSVTASSGSLRADVHLSEEWRSTLIDFVAQKLPLWRDDPQRPTAEGETTLTAQLCGYLNGATRLSEGWDFLQFRREEPDETLRGRAIDLVAAPSGVNIWIEGRNYTEYCSLLPIECKRLPTPKGTKRDEREYLFSQYSSTGGIQRFKAGHHGAAHRRAVLIAYVQDNNIQYWNNQINQWVSNLASNSEHGWEEKDKICLIAHNMSQRVAVLESKHLRNGKLEPITIDHLWVEI